MVELFCKYVVLHFLFINYCAIIALRSPKAAAFAWSPAGGEGKPSGMLFHGLVMQDWWHSILKCSRLVSFGSIVSLVADTQPALTPHAQRMKSP